MLSTFAAAALVATVAASQVVTFDNTDVTKIIDARNYAKVVNRCSYPVYLWSIDKEFGCSKQESTELATGDAYYETFRNGTNGGGISIKISKWDTCGGKDITQLEYMISQNAAYPGNYLDMSFVDCLNNLEDCPGRTDGFYLKSGNTQEDINISAVNNEHCPIFKVNNAEEAAAVSYINWDDRQTKYCSDDEPLELYLCGSEAPSEEDETDEPVASSSAAPSSYAEVESSSTPVAVVPSSTSVAEKPTSAAPAPTSSAEEDFVKAAAAVTPAPSSSPPAVIKTEVVYVTEYVNKRHAHGRRHQHFHA